MPSLSGATPALPMITTVDTKVCVEMYVAMAELVDGRTLDVRQIGRTPLHELVFSLSHMLVSLCGRSRFVRCDSYDEACDSRFR